MANCSCGSDQKVRIVYACSGAADVGSVADRTARQLAKEGWARMSCLAAMGAELSGFVESAKTSENVVIDGCPVNCGTKIFQKLNIPYTSITLTQEGLVKGETPVTDQVTSNMATLIKAKM